MGIASLDTATPTSSTLASTGAADIRALRVAIRETFVNFGIGTDVVTATAAQINGAPNKAGAETISGAWNFTSGTTMNGISNAVGTEAIPAYSFSSDPDTGIYSESANVVNVATSGGKRLSVTATELRSFQPVWAPDGSAAAPAYTFTADSTTGFYRSNATEISFTAVGNRAVSFNDSGVELRRIGGNWTGIEFWNSAGDRKALFDLDSEAGNVALYPVTGSGDGTYGPYVFAYDQSTASFSVGYPIRVSGGSSTDPTYTFGSDPDTGIYQNGYVKLGFTVDGVIRGYFDAAGTLNLTGDFGVGGTSYFTGLTGASNPVTNNNTTIPNTSDVLFEVNKRTAVMSLQNNSEAVAVGTAEIANWTNKTVSASPFLTDDISGGRITVASGMTGYYRVTAQGTIRSTVGSITATIEVRKNGSALSHPAQTKITLPVNQYGSFSLDCCVYCTAADYLSLFSTVTTSDGTIDNLHFTVSRAV